jgi:hypothetical protein
MRVLPSMSVKRNVSVPVGGEAGVGFGIGSAGPFAILAAYSGQFAKFGQLPTLAPHHRSGAVGAQVITSGA